MSHSRLVPTPAALSVAVALAVSGGLMYTDAAQAAGLGRLTVQSALGQPLRAEVEITSLSPEESSSLSASLASPDAFRQAGLEYNPALTGLVFKIDRRADGRAVVRISSSRPINEPFVDLLVELNWSSGKFAREYTFLLDPQDLRIGKNETIEGGAATTSPVAAPSAATPAPAPAAAAPAPVVVPAPAPAPMPAPTAQRPAAAPMPAPRPARPAPAAPRSVEVARGDTLAAIATRVKPGSVSLNQAMVAIYRANPDAFFGGVHQMRAGTTLTIPGEQAMSSLSRSEVAAEMRASRKAFDEYRARLAAAAKEVGGEQGGQRASGAIAEPPKPAEAAAAGDQLRLSKGSTEGATGAGNAAGSKAAETEAAVARDNALREAQSRIDELEKNVGDLQKLLELKNKQLADVEQQLAQARDAAKATSGTIMTPAAPAAESPKPAMPVAEAPKPEAAGEAAPQAEMPKAEAPAAEAPKAEAPAAEAPKPEAPKPAAPVAQAPAPAPAPEPPSFVDQLRENPYVLLGGGALVLLGGFYAWYSRRRRKTAEKFEDSLGGTDAFTANSLFGTTGGQNVDTSNSLFSTNIRDSGVDVHSTEVDPIAEAEVYIAYGREAQAEEILKEALKKQPERHAIRLKLLEIYAGRKDVASFNELARDMYEQSGGTNEEWPKVVTLGLSIDPENPLYTGRADVGGESDVADAAPGKRDSDPGSAAGAVAAGAIAGTAGLMEALDRPQDESAEPLASAAPDQADAITDLEFTMPEDSAGGRREDEGGAQAVESDLEGFDFDIDVDSRIVPDDSAAAGGEAISDLDMPSLDMPGDESSRPTTSDERSDLSRALEGKMELPSLDLGEGDRSFSDSGSRRGDAMADLGDLNVDIPSLETLRGQTELDPSAVDLSAIGLDLSPESVSGPAAGGEGNRWQEMATKLDLASAYEEIGDKEGARELLEEVARGGDSEQQQKARAMLSKIN